MERNEAAHIIEAILFVAGEPVGIGDVAAALGLTELETVQTVEEMQRQYDLERRGVTLRRYGDHLRMETRQEYAPYVERLLQPVQRQSLTQTAMETLAVIAYRQPATKGEVEQIRGVKCDYSIQSLLNKGLIKEVGRKEALGRPILYATTDRFLEHFGLSDIRELPPLPAAEQGAEPRDPRLRAERAGQGVTPCTPDCALCAQGAQENAAWPGFYCRSATGLAARGSGRLRCSLF
ncbi:MAG: SMC-Scp complex subunit ScpB [Eubacteriales bacterium]|nr:SMC-Scp complex subunit ScpB [Eubacteriales bacterium]